MKKIISWILRLVVAGILLQTLYFKFSAHPDSVHIFTLLGIEPYGRIGLGIIELIVAMAVLMPKFKFAGIIASIGIMAGAIISHIMVLGIEVSGDGGNLFALANTVMISSLGYLFLNLNEFILTLKTLIK